jgi:outer membrane cobalamin receptor
MKRILAGFLLLQAGLARADTWADSIYQLREVLVVAERAPTRAALVAMSSERADRSVLTADLNAWLGTLTGIQARSYGQPGGQSSMSIWGASSQQGLVLLDGHPIANPISGTPDLGLLAAPELSGVEVVRGANSSLYGSSALGGVVNLVPESPTNHLPGKWYGNAGIDAGTFRSVGGQGLLGRRYADWGVQAHASFLRADGPRSNDPSSVWNAGLGFGLYPQRDLRLTLSAALADRGLGLPGPVPAPGAIPRFGDSTASSLYDHESDRQARADASLQWSPAEMLSIEFKPDWRHLQTRFVSLYPWAESESSTTRDDYTSTSFGQALIASYTFKGYRLVAGYDNAFDFAQVVSQSDTDWQAASGNHALWTELKAPVAGIVYLGGSVRADFNPGFRQSINPGFGIALPVRNWLKFRAHWGTAFRAPSISDRYWPKSGVPDLKPEHGSTLQAGLDIYSDRVNVEASAFLRRTSDLISWLPDTGGLWRPTNVDSSRHLGAEVSLDIRPVQGLTLRSSATFLAASQTRKELVYSPAWPEAGRYEFRTRRAAFLPVLGANAEVACRFAFGTRLSLSGWYSSERLGYYPNWDSAPVIRMDTKRLPAFAVLDAGVTQTLFRHWDLSLRVTNALDARYSEQFGNSLRDRDYPMAGRSVAIQLRYDVR